MIYPKSLHALSGFSFAHALPAVSRIHVQITAPPGG
jgi:hypothetical protein